MESKNNDWLMCLMVIALEFVLSKKKIWKIWDDFESEISNCNRYFPKAESICGVLDFYSQKAIYQLPKSKTIFRARLIKSHSQNELPEHTKALFTFFSEFGSTKEQDPTVIENINSHHDFWGFGPKDSDAAPHDRVLAGRINPAGISYLHAAEDSHTAMVEVRPVIGQMVSVAEVEINKDLILFDFCANLSNGDDTESEELKIFEEIARRLSMPNYIGDTGYLSTQYVSSYIKNLKCGFDGIRFGSSLHKNGVNIVLFDTSQNNETKNYTIKNSSIHVVNDITILEEKFLPSEKNDFLHE